LLQKTLFRLRIRMVAVEALEGATYDQALARQTFEELRQMRATWRVFLRMELENNTKYIK